MDTELREAECLGQVLETAKDDRADWDALVKGIKNYETLCEKLQDIELGKQEYWNVRINIPEQFRREIGSRLLNANPRVRTAVKDWALEIDPTAVPQAELMEYVLNHGIEESDCFDELKDSRDSGLTTGRGAQIVGIDRKRGVPISVDFDPMDLWLDPDAQSWRECNIAFRRRLRPRYWWVRRFPDHKTDIAAAPASQRPTDVNAKNKQRNSALDLVEGYECWSKIGLHNYKDGLLFDTEREDVPQKFWLLGRQQAYVLLGKGPWETPFHLESGRAAWPFECFDCYSKPNSLYPDPPLRPAWPWIQALNFLVAIFVWRMRRSMELNIAVVSQDGVEINEDSLVSLLQTADGQVLRILKLTTGIDPDASPNIRNYVQYMDENFNIGQFLESLAFIRRMIAEESGLHEFLYAGEPMRQDRSAAATNARVTNSSNRIVEYQTNFDEFANRLLRKQALAARYLLRGDDIAPYAGPQAAMVWDAFNMADYGRFFQETAYDIELGSIRRKTPEQAAEAAEVIINHALGPLQALGATETLGVVLELFLKDAIQLDPQNAQTIKNEFAMLAQRNNLAQQVESLQAQLQQMQSQVSGGSIAPGGGG